MSVQEISSSQEHGGNLLDMFYKDPKRWAYTFQVMVCTVQSVGEINNVCMYVIGGVQNLM